MKRSRMVIIGVVAIGAVAATLAVRSARGDAEAEGPPSITVASGDVVQKALAVGTIEPETEVEVKSKVGGVIRRLYVDEGGYVTAGQPLLEVRPDPAPVEMVDARREVQIRQVALDNAQRELDRQRNLSERGLAPRQEVDRLNGELNDAVLQVRRARERLQLLQGVSVGGAESVVRSPISGYVLQAAVEVGDPVTPLSTYQEGTVLMTMADMRTLIFRGTVDEIDVGKLQEGMPVEIRIGALPDARVSGVVSRISLKARREENATTFPVEITLQAAEGTTLRAGLSANAEIIIQRRQNVLTVPERVVTFAGDTAWVNVRRADGTAERRVIRTGLSDALNVEVLSGLRAGERVMEKPGKSQ
jgi:HlyD family secretion protein